MSAADMVTDAIVHPQRVDDNWLPVDVQRGVVGASFVHSGMLAAADALLADLQQQQVRCLLVTKINMCLLVHVSICCVCYCYFPVHSYSPRFLHHTNIKSNTTVNATVNKWMHRHQGEWSLPPLAAVVPLQGTQLSSTPQLTSEAQVPSSRL